jgi:hypothetical protein
MTTPSDFTEWECGGYGLRPRHSAWKPSGKGGVRPTVIIDLISNSEGGQPAKRGIPSRTLKQSVVEPGSVAERPSWNTKFVAELGKHAARGEHGSTTSQSGVHEKEVIASDEDATIPQTADEDREDREDRVDVEVADSDDDTYHPTLSSGVKPRLYHEDSWSVLQSRRYGQWWLTRSGTRRPDAWPR